MTKTIRMLLVFLLTAGLFLVGASALAETGRITYTVPADTDKGFTNLEGIAFELYRVADSVGEGTAWKETSDFPGLGFDVAPSAEDSNVWSEGEVEAFVAKIEERLAENPGISTYYGDENPTKTDENGQIIFDNLTPGIYYIKKNEDSRPQLLTVTPTLIAVPSLSASDPYDLKVTAKRDYEAPGKTKFTVNKVWVDDNDFDGMRPDPFQVTVRLHRTLDGEDDEGFELVQVLDAENNWTYTWTGIECRDENGKEYNYSVDEDDVSGYTKKIVYSSVEDDDANNYDKVIHTATITNTHTPQYGAIRVTKSVLLNGAATTGQLADGEFNFTITGPTSYTEPKKKNDLNYLNEVGFKITVTDGKASSWARSGLMPGKYVIKEATSGLPVGMSVVGSDEQTVEVKAGTTASAPLDVGFTNNRVMGSLKITKTVTVNGSGTGTTRADGTYRFTVTGPSYPGGQVVSIKIRNGKSNSVQLDNLILGEYEVSEVKSGMPSGVSYVSGDSKKTLVAANTVTSPLTFDFVNNRTVPSGNVPPSEGRTNPPTTPPRSPEVSTSPSPTPSPVPTPTPTPTPTPLVSINGQKVWNDASNAHGTRPTSIKVQLLRDGEQIREVTVTGKGNRWSFSFGTLPKVDANGAVYHYTIREIPVEGYTTTVNGTTVVNDLVEQPPKNYTTLTGNKIWKDDESNTSARPNYIVVRLMRDGKEVDRRTVTAANGWQFTFQNIPLDDGYGHQYTYTIREDSVPGYVGMVEDMVVTNSKLPEREELTELGRYGTPLSGFGEPELDNLLELYDYGTPLWGRPLKTGDELPLYPIVFGGIGGTALIALVVLMIVGKKRKNSAA